MSSTYFPPDTRVYYIKDTLLQRERAQKYARKADKWRHVEDELWVELLEAVEGGPENHDKKGGKKLRNLHRHACRRVEWYEKMSIRHMKSAYQSALLALHMDPMSSEEIRALNKEWKEKWEKALKGNY